MNDDIKNTGRANGLALDGKTAEPGEAGGERAISERGEQAGAAGPASRPESKASPKMERSGDPTAGLDDPVPRLPRGRGLKLSRIELIRVVGLAAVLVFLIVTQRPCANAVSTFVTGFDRGAGSAGARPPPPPGATPGSAGTPAAAGSAGDTAGRAGSDLEHYEQLRPGMTDDEIKAAIERARSKSAAGSGTR